MPPLPDHLPSSFSHPCSIFTLPSSTFLLFLHHHVFSQHTSLSTLILPILIFFSFHFNYHFSSTLHHPVFSKHTSLYHHPFPILVLFFLNLIYHFSPVLHHHAFFLPHSSHFSGYLSLSLFIRFCLSTVSL